MRKNYAILLTLLIALIAVKSSNAQIETRLATNCATENVEIPIIIKQLENIKNFQLMLIYDNDKLQLDTSYYHYAAFTITDDDNLRIKVSVSNDTITINWAAYYSVSIEDDLLLSLAFTELASGSANFTWIEDECFYKDFNNLILDDTLIVDAPIDVPHATAVDISFEQFTIGCRDNSESGGCKAQAEVNIIGGQGPYSYQWNDKFTQNDSIAIGLCEDPVSVVIGDAGGCFYGAIFDPVIYPAAIYDIQANPEEVYITTPIVDFTIETEDEYIETYLWDFGDESTSTNANTSHAYAQVGSFMVSLKTENIDGCDTTIQMTFEVKELEFCIPNVFTPNGDGINDEWIFKILDGSSAAGDTKSAFKTGFIEEKKCSGEDMIFDEHLKSSYLVVMNRNGRTVYDCTNCSEYWDGSGLPDGTYFYVFTWEGEYSNGKEQGNVTILGSN